MYLCFAALRTSCNKVRPDDFIYYSVIGRGSYGKVVHAKKKSTGVHYAVKILSKKHLLVTFGDNKDYSNVDIEVRALAAISHPFIVGMDYAYQTSRFGMIAMELAPGDQISDMTECYR